MFKPKLRIKQTPYWCTEWDESKMKYSVEKRYIFLWLSQSYDASDGRNYVYFLEDKETCKNFLKHCEKSSKVIFKN